MPRRKTECAGTQQDIILAVDEASTNTGDARTVASGGGYCKTRQTLVDSPGVDGRRNFAPIWI